MNRIVAIISTIVLSVASATAGIRHYCDTTPAIPGLTIQGTPDYSTSYIYDLNGNPTQIYRKGIAHKYTSGSNRQWQYDEIDNLYIDYRGNQVSFTDDSCPWGYYEDAPGYIEESYEDNEYTWDANGNMTKDLNRGITSIQYNLQNMPTRIVYNDRHYEGRIYNSAGQKLRTIHTVFVTSSTSSSTSTAALITENKRDYYGEDLVYRNDTLEMVLTNNGYVDAGGNYHYYVRDYQGNIRQVVDVQGNVIEQNDYYPYGGLFGESASLQSYKYSGKELERMNGLNTYDFHARPYYYPTLQFHSPDILSEKTPWLSPYLYCAANPIMLIDPTGMFIKSSSENSTIFNTKYDRVRLALREKGLSHELDAVQNSETYGITIIDAAKIKGGSRYEPKTKTLYLDLDNVIISEDGTVNSPLFVTRHEFDHIHAHMTDPEGYIDRVNNTDPKYGNEEEKRVLNNGDVNAGNVLNEPTRKEYMQTTKTPIEDPTSNYITPELIEKLVNELKEFIYKSKK